MGSPSLKHMCSSANLFGNVEEKTGSQRGVEMASNFNLSVKTVT